MVIDRWTAIDMRNCRRTDKSLLIRIMALAPVWILAVLFSGCSTNAVKTVVDLTPGQQKTSNLLWPAPPEVPRFQYIGTLLGEQNIRLSNGEQASESGGFWRWLTGVRNLPRDPIVLQRPQGGVTDIEGRVFVADVSRQAVFVFDTPSGELRVWEFADERRRFVAPVGIAIDHNGQILVTDAELKAVFRYDTSGRYLGHFGDHLLKRPTGIAFDSERNVIYVADTEASDIKAFDTEGNLLDTLGILGAEQGQLNRPVYLAYSQGLLYVSDALNSRIQVFDRDGNAIKVVGQRGMYIGNLTRPKGVAVDDEGHIYVVEGFYDHLLVFNRDGRFLMAIGGTGSNLGQFYLPTSVWTDKRNRIYVADMFNGRVSIFQFLGEEQ